MKLFRSFIMLLTCLFLSSLLIGCWKDNGFDQQVGDSSDTQNESGQYIPNRNTASSSPEEVSRVIKRVWEYVQNSPSFGRFCAKSFRDLIKHEKGETEAVKAYAKICSGKIEKEGNHIKFKPAEVRTLKDYLSQTELVIKDEDCRENAAYLPTTGITPSIEGRSLCISVRSFVKHSPQILVQEVFGALIRELILLHGYSKSQAINLQRFFISKNMSYFSQESAFLRAQSLSHKLNFPSISDDLVPMLAESEFVIVNAATRFDKFYILVEEMIANSDLSEIHLSPKDQKSFRVFESSLYKIHKILGPIIEKKFMVVTEDEGRTMMRATLKNLLGEIDIAKTSFMSYVHSNFEEFEYKIFEKHEVQPSAN